MSEWLALSPLILGEKLCSNLMEAVGLLVSGYMLALVAPTNSDTLKVLFCITNCVDQVTCDE